jgi:hypothetical protein
MVFVLLIFELSIELPYDPTILVLRVSVSVSVCVCEKEIKSVCQRHVIPMSNIELFTITKIWNQWTQRKCVYLYNLILFSN